jgi:hypothetical protein
VISHLSWGQKSKREYISISIDSINAIEIIDHQNLNYDWYYGRKYQIRKNNEHYVLTRTSQYSKPYIFGRTEDTVKLNNTPLLDKLKITKNKDSLVNMINSVGASRHSWYSSRVKLENIGTATEIGEIEKDKIQALVNAITVKRESYINFILANLDIDSAWLESNAARLWELYKPKESKISAKAKEYCIKCLKNFKYAQHSSYAIQERFGTSDYPYVEIKLICKRDTLIINTRGQLPFMLPWNMNNKYESYNPNIAIALADILPYDEYSNRDRLLGSKDSGEYSFEGILSRGIIFGQCFDRTKKRKKWKLKEE